MRPAGASRGSIEGLRNGAGGLARLQGRLVIDDGGEELRLHEAVDSLKSLAFPAIAVGGAALVVQQHFKIVT